MNENNEKLLQQEAESISLPEFLEGTPPSQITSISKIVKVTRFPDGTFRSAKFLTPEIQLHCPNDACGGTRFFRCLGEVAPEITDGAYTFFYLTYRCSNCQKTEKTFSLGAVCDRNALSGRCFKFGELPTYGPPTPARLIRLIGPDREIFLQGRRCENHALGIGAFVYYRRVVENQKNRILDEIIKVSKKFSVSKTMIEKLEGAKSETQFSKAIESVKDSMPQALMINGHNPLTLLYSALSKGIHNRSDEDCLKIASSIRIVLAELSERLSQALKDEAEINNALSQLIGTKKDDQKELSSDK
jgi:hypothetical protein